MTYESLYSEFKMLMHDDAEYLQKLENAACVDDTDGMHIIFGMVVVPYVIDLLKTEKTDKLHKVFTYFEEMAKSKDTLICEVLEFTVLEDLISNGTDILNNSKKYMMSETLASCKAVETYMM